MKKPGRLAILVLGRAPIRTLVGRVAKNYGQFSDLLIASLHTGWIIAKLQDVKSTNLYGAWEFCQKILNKKTVGTDVS